MDKLKKYTKEIFELTRKLEEEYPELYRYLDENPLTISQSSDPNLDSKALSDHLETLRELLRHHLETHKKAGGDGPYDPKE